MKKITTLAAAAALAASPALAGPPKTSVTAPELAALRVLRLATVGKEELRAGLLRSHSLRFDRGSWELFAIATLKAPPPDDVVSFTFVIRSNGSIEDPVLVYPEAPVEERWPLSDERVQRALDRELAFWTEYALRRFS